jgi:L-asparaginase
VPDASATHRIAVFGLGGTIAMTGDATGGVTPTLTAADLVAAVPGLSGTDAILEVTDFRRVPGASLDPADVLALVAAVNTAFADGVDGAVVTQGTDTIEETAYLADLHYAGDRPVVFTGAMRNPTMAGADGPANLLAAVRTAARGRARGPGVLVVLADEIHSARRVRKTHSTSGSAFQSPNGGPLGYLVEGVPRLLNSPPRRLVVPVPGRAAAPRVALAAIALGDRGELLDGLAGRVDGLVIAAMGVGHVPERLVATLEKLAATMPVVLTSRTGAGSVLTATYGFPGSERDLIARGLVPAGFLDPFKARLLLRAALSLDADRVTVGAAFAVAGGYRDPSAWPWPARGQDDRGRAGR